MKAIKFRLKIRKYFDEKHDLPPLHFPKRSVADFDELLPNHRQFYLINPCAQANLENNNPHFYQNFQLLFKSFSIPFC